MFSPGLTPTVWRTTPLLMALICMPDEPAARTIAQLSESVPSSQPVGSVLGQVSFSEIVLYHMRPTAVVPEGGAIEDEVPPAFQVLMKGVMRGSHAL